MALLTSVKGCYREFVKNWQHWIDAVKWIVWNIFWGLFPLWMGFIILRVFRKNPSLVDLSDNGEFLIYGATMLAAALYIVFKDYKSSKFPFRREIATGCVVILMIVAVLFTGISAANTDRLRFYDISREFIRGVSYWIYIISIVLAFFLTGLDNRRSRVDIIVERESQMRDLEKDFNRERG